MIKTSVSMVKEALFQYQEVTWRKGCLSWPQKDLMVSFSGVYYRFEKLSEVWVQSFDKNHQYPVILHELEEGDADIHITHHYNNALENDGFCLTIQIKNNVVIESKNIRGFQYGMEALLECFYKIQDTIFLPEILIRHEPSIKIRGIIEGFYGNPWSKEARLALLPFMKSNHLNSYMYAPKDDALLRKQWREFYKKEQLNELLELITEAEKHQINFWYMISPGNDIDITSDDDIQTLLNKLEQLISIGVSRFGLLLDDIDYHLKGKAKQQFSEPALAHAYLVNQVNEFLSSRLANSQLVVCPTEYDNRFGSRYLEILSREVPVDIPFFWTGPSTLADSITAEELQIMSKAYQRSMIIWDNVPVNDYLNDKELLFMSPYQNRTSRISEKKFDVIGVVSNPMAQIESSKFTIGSMAEYLWNCQRFDPYQSWPKVVEKIVGSRLRDTFILFASFFPNYYTNNPFTMSNYLQSQDSSWVTEKIVQLNEVAKVIRNSKEIPELKNELLPWLNVIEDTASFWKLWKENPKYGKEWLLKKERYRIGHNIVKSHIEFIMNEESEKK